MTAETTSPLPPSLKQKAVAFTRPEQIAKILTEVCRLRIEVLLRYSTAGKVVRGVAETFNPIDKSLLISGISNAGDALLTDYEKVRVEFVLLSTKLVFDTQIRARTTGKLVLATPVQLVSIERRRNARFKVPSTQAAFVGFDDEHVDVSRFDAPFIPKFLIEEKFLLPKLRVDDVSLGGLACFTRYSAVAQLLKPSEMGSVAHIEFPNMAALEVPVSIRWIKKTLNAVPLSRYPSLEKTMPHKGKAQTFTAEQNLKETYFRVGLQFAEVSQDLDAALRRFIHTVQTAESV